MDTHTIYEEVMHEYYFNKMKHLRDQWRGREKTYNHGVSSLININDDDYRQVEFIMQKSSDLIIEMLNMVIKRLLKQYNIPVKYYDLRKDEAEAFYVGKESFL